MNTTLKAPIIETAYRGSLRILEARSRWSPTGWQPAIRELMVKLEAVDCLARSDLVLTGPKIRTAELSIEVSRPDPVVEGILRKTRLVTRFTCHRCGCPGRPRPVLDRILPCCASCFVRFELHAGLRKIFDTVDAVSVDYRRGEISLEDVSVSIRRLLPRAVWERRSTVQNPGVQVRLSRHQLRKHEPWLKLVQHEMRDWVVFK